jgi:formylglycine-generating enzyme required for sulfatase activity
MMKHSAFIFLAFTSLVLLAITAGCGSHPPKTATATSTPQPSPTITPEPSSTPTRDVVIVTPLPLQARLDEKGIEQVWVPAGSFMIGTSEEDAQALLAIVPVSNWLQYALDRERPQHEVRIQEGFWLDRFEVTNAAFQAFIDDNGYEKAEYWSEAGWKWLSKQSPGSRPKQAGSKPNVPRNNVTWYEAEAYAHWRGGRLPTEAEWEYAARGPDALIYPWGNEFDTSLCNVVQSSGLKPVGSYPRGSSWVNALDMAGNVMEWVQDWYDIDYYKLTVRDDPLGPETGQVKVEKGGWFSGPRGTARSAYGHYEDPPTYSDDHIGFRINSR